MTSPKDLKSGPSSPNDNLADICLINRKYHDKFLISGGLLEIVIALTGYFSSKTALTIPLINFAVMVILLKMRKYNALKALFVVSNFLMVYQLRSQSSQLFIIPVQMILVTVKISILTKCIFTSFSQLLILSGVGILLMEDNFKSAFFSHTQEELWEFFSYNIHFTYFMSVIALLYLTFYNSQANTFINEVQKLQASLNELNSKLEVKNEELQRTIKMKDLFVLTFSHELKNALNALLGNLELSLIESKDLKIIGYLQSALASGQSISNFVHNMLETGKLENGTFEVVKEPTDLPSFLEKTWHILREMIRNKRLDGSLTVSSNLPKWLEIDGQRLRQILLNLVSNAVKFTERGYIRVTIGWSKEDSDDEASLQVNRYSQEAEPLKVKVSGEKRLMLNHWGYALTLDKKNWSPNEKFYDLDCEGEQGVLTVQVIDSGCGIQSFEIPMLGEKFKQLQQARETRARGNGLGLWITKQILKRLEGELTIQSKEKFGSTFAVKIPTATAKSVSLSMDYVGETAASSNSKGSSYSSAGKLSLILKNSLGSNRSSVQSEPKKVLIVDDDTFNVELMQNFLNKIQVPFFVGYDGKDAIEIVRNNASEISLIVTDNYMPGLCGVEAVPQIRKILKEKNLPQIPIFCVSADETAKFKEECKEAEMDGLLRKPVDFAKFKELINHHIHNN